MNTITIEIPQRNLSIIEYLAQGLTQKEIANKIGLTPKYVANIVWGLLDAYGCKNSTELVAFMIDAGVVKYKKSA